MFVPMYKIYKNTVSIDKQTKVNINYKEILYFSDEEKQKQGREIPALFFMPDSIMLQSVV